jgi:hypothetical protein
MFPVRLWVFPLLAALSLGASAEAAAVPVRSKKQARPRIPEAVEMIVSILKGGGAGPGSGWFHPSQSLYDWKWLAARMDADRDGAVTRKKFKGAAALFDRLDRDGDGRLTPADFDWSARSPLVRQNQLATTLFYRGNAKGNGRLSKKEWQALFEQAAKGKDHLTPEDLRELLYPPRSAMRRGKPSDNPTRWTLLKGLFLGEIGSMNEGPALGDRAPDFRLPTQDGKKTIALSDYRGKKPVVLIFGNFT